MSGLVECACGCGRFLPSDAPWDGMHGPSSTPATLRCSHGYTEPEHWQDGRYSCPAGLEVR